MKLSSIFKPKAAFPFELVKPEIAEVEKLLFEQARATLLATEPAGYAGVCAALRDGDLSDSVQSVSTPTLVIGGHFSAGHIKRDVDAFRFAALDNL